LVVRSQVNAEKEQEDKKGQSMVNKVLMMKEDITQEVCRRVAAMQDREERAVNPFSSSSLRNACGLPTQS
jgi:hypothetical protein